MGGCPTCLGEFCRTQAYTVHHHVNRDDISFPVVRRNDPAPRMHPRKDRAVLIAERDASKGLVVAEPGRLRDCERGRSQKD